MKTQHDSEILAKGLQVVTVCAVIYRFINGVPQIFMAKRAQTKKFLPGVFELPGGHVDFGENPIKALEREIMEEFQVEIKVEDPFYVFDYINQVKQSHSFEIIYFSKQKNPNQIFQLNPEDHETSIWITKDEISKVFTDNKGMDDEEIKAVLKAFDKLSTR